MPHSLPWLTARPIAHRGLHDAKHGVIENTRSAFSAAIAGNYAIECDLQLTADGEAVVFHDETLDRLTTATGKLVDCDTGLLQSVTFKACADRIQTLAELLQQVEGRVPLVIELKSHWNHDDRLARRALAILEGYTGPYCFMSFDPDVVETLRTLSPRTIRGIVADRAEDPAYDALPEPRRRELQSFAHLGRTDPHFASFYWRDLPWEPITRFRASGKPVITWTLRSATDAATALQYCDQVTFEGYVA